MSLSGKTAFITGGGSGIGAACALAFAKAGCRVAISGRREEKLKEVASRHQESPKIDYHVLDVGEREQVNKVVDWANKTLGRIDILLNSAGVNIAKRQMHQIDPEDWDRLLRINATGTFNTMHAVLPQMRERKDGLIINISSVAGLRANPLGGVAYCASKFAVTALGTSVGQEDRHNGIRVTNVYPGEVDTELLKARPVPVTAEHRAKILKPEDVAAMILAIAQLPPLAHVPEILIKPLGQEFV